MKTIAFVIIGILMLAVTAAFSAGTNGLATVPYPIVSTPSFPGTIQMFAPNGTTTTALTVVSTTVDLRNYIMYGIESGSGTTCYVRLMPTSSKGSYVQTLLRTAGTHHIRAKNTATPFLNISGCTAGSYTLQ